MTPSTTSPDSRFFHATLLVGPEHVLLRRQDYRDFVGALAESLQRRPVRLIAYCLLTDECHLVVGPTVPAAVRATMAGVGTTRPLRSRTRRWSARASLQLRSLNTTWALVDAARSVEARALGRRLVRRAQDWPWSSLGNRLRSEGVLPLVSTPFLSSRAWVEYVNASSAARGDLAEHPGVLANRLQAIHQDDGVVRTAHQNQSDAHVERAKHLCLGDAAGPLEPGKQRRNDPALSIE